MLGIPTAPVTIEEQADHRCTGFGLHTTSPRAGKLFIALGVSLIVFQGGSVLSGMYADLGIEEFSFAAQDWLAVHLFAGVELVVLAVVLLGTGVLWWRRSLRACAPATREAQLQK